MIPPPCGRPTAPVSARREDGTWACHCGRLLDALTALPTTYFPTSPGPAAHCPRCDCHVALVGSDWHPGSDPPPTSAQACAARSDANRRMEGYGAEVSSVEPCPFCGASDFLVLRLGDLPASADVGHDGLCRLCGREARYVVTLTLHGMEVELVQTGGPPPPAWYEPAPRRLDRDDV